MPYDLESAIAVKENEDGLLEIPPKIDLESAVPLPVNWQQGSQEALAEQFQEYNKMNMLEGMIKANPMPAEFEKKPDWLLSTVDEVGKQLQDLLTMPARIMGTPHPPMASKLSTETIPDLLPWAARPNEKVYTGRTILVKEADLTPEQKASAQLAANRPGWYEVPEQQARWEIATEQAANVTVLAYGGAQLFKFVKNELGIRALARDVNAKAEEYADLFIKTNPADEVGKIQPEYEAKYRVTLLNAREALVNEFKMQALNKLSAIEETAGGWQNVAQGKIREMNFARLLAQELRLFGAEPKIGLTISLTPKVGQAVSFTNAQGVVMEGIIREITGQRAIIDMVNADGVAKSIVATLSQIVPNVPPEIPAEGKVYYHGTYSKFKEFMTPQEMPEDIATEVLGQPSKTFGIYFTPSKELAGEFGDKIIEAKLNINKPLDLKGVKTFEELVSKLPIDIKVGYNENTLRNIKLDSRFDDDYFSQDIYRALEMLVDKFDLLPKIKAQGYDAILFNDRENGIKGETVIVFDKLQINLSAPAEEGQKPPIKPPKTKVGGAGGEEFRFKPESIKPDISGITPLQKQIQAMKDRLGRVEVAKDALEEINNERNLLKRRITKYKDEYLKEELTGIPSIYITKKGGIKPDEAIDELRQRGIEVNDEVGLKEYLQNLEKARKDLIAEIETYRPGFVTKKETTLLADKIKAVEMGIREGKIQAKEEIKQVQEEIIDMMQGLNLEAKDKAKFLALMKNVQTKAQLQKALPEITNRLTNIRDKSERMEAIEDIKTLFAKHPTQNMPLHYKDQIEAIKVRIDPRQQAPSTKKKIESLRAFVKRMEEAGEAINIPEDKLALLEKTSLDELTTDELNLLKSALEQLYHQGKVFNRLLTDKKGRQIEEIVKNIVSDILKGKEISADSSFVKALQRNNKSLRGKSLDVIKNSIYANLRPELMLNMLGKEITECLFKPLNEADVSELSNSDKSTRKIWDSQKAINIPQAYIKKYNVGRYKGVTKNNALHIYAHSKNEEQLAHLYASGLTDEDIKDFSNFLSIEERGAVEKLWDFYYNDQWVRLEEKYSVINGVHLPRINFYFPIMNLERPADSYSKELEDEMMKRFYLKQAGVAKGFTKERVASELAFSSFDYFGTIIKNHEQVEHYIAYAEAIRDANKLLRNADIRAAIEQKYGKKYLKILDKWLKDAAYGGDKAINNILDEMALFFTQNYVTSVLGYNILSASKSLVSFMTGVDKIGEHQVIRAIGKFIHHPIQCAQFVYGKSEMMRLRDFTQEREFKQILAGREAYLGQAKLWQKFKEWSSIPMMISDKVTVIPLWLAQYDDVMRTGNLLTNPNLEQEAIEAADTLIRRTQPMGRPLHLPETFRGGPFQRAYTLFTNQLNQNFNREYEQTSKMLNKDIKKREWLNTQLYLVVLSGLLIGMLARRRLPTAKEMVYDSISQIAGGVFFIGNVADSIALALLTKRGGLAIRALAPKSFGALTEITYAAASKTMRGRFKHLIAAMSSLTGFPYIQARRTIQILEDTYDYLTEELGNE